MHCALHCTSRIGRNCARKRQMIAMSGSPPAAHLPEQHAYLSKPGVAQRISSFQTPPPARTNVSRNDRGRRQHKRSSGESDEGADHDATMSLVWADAVYGVLGFAAPSCSAAAGRAPKHPGCVGKHACSLRSVPKTSSYAGARFRPVYTLEGDARRRKLRGICWGKILSAGSRYAQVLAGCHYDTHCKM